MYECLLRSPFVLAASRFVSTLFVFSVFAFDFFSSLLMISHRVCVYVCVFEYVYCMIFYYVAFSDSLCDIEMKNIFSPGAAHQTVHNHITVTIYAMNSKGNETNCLVMAPQNINVTNSTAKVLPANCVDGFSLDDF